MTQTKKNTFSIRIMSVILALITVFSAFSLTGEVAMAAGKTPAAAYSAVKKAYGKSFPFKKSNRVKGKRRVMGVKTADLKSYYAASKVTGGKNSKCEYIIMVAKVKDSGKVKTIKSQLTRFKKNEEASMKNYLSSKGKKLFKNAKVGSVGSFVYIVMIDTNSNKKAVKAIKKTLG
ncbi:MAG: DUF4358 domain-containing protein [Eubacterium sp.]|nr:DUF4358 domain-containing protein [Eubacterium sp.]